LYREDVGMSKYLVENLFGILLAVYRVRKQDIEVVKNIANMSRKREVSADASFLFCL